MTFRGRKKSAEPIAVAQRPVVAIISGDGWRVRTTLYALPGLLMTSEPSLLMLAWSRDAENPSMDPDASFTIIRRT